MPTSERTLRLTGAGSAMALDRLLIQRLVDRDATKARGPRTRAATHSKCAERNMPRAVPCLLKPGRSGDSRVRDFEKIDVLWPDRFAQFCACSQGRGTS